MPLFTHDVLMARLGSLCVTHITLFPSVILMLLMYGQCLELSFQRGIFSLSCSIVFRTNSDLSFLKDETSRPCRYTSNIFGHHFTSTMIYWLKNVYIVVSILFLAKFPASQPRLHERKMLTKEKYKVNAEHIDKGKTHRKYHNLNFQVALTCTLLSSVFDQG